MFTWVGVGELLRTLLEYLFLLQIHTLKLNYENDNIRKWALQELIGSKELLPQEWDSTCAAGKTWRHPRAAGFYKNVGCKNNGSRRPPLRLQEKACECGRMIHETGRQKLKLQGRAQEIQDASNEEQLQRKATGNQQGQPRWGPPF